MIRVTPFRFTTLQCSQIGRTLVRTFTVALSVLKPYLAKTLKIESLV
jgi:hypothetical protein